MKNLAKTSLIPFFFLLMFCLLSIQNVLAAVTLTTSNQTSTQITIKADGLTVGQNYRFNVNNAAGVWQFGFDLSPATSVSYSAPIITSALAPGDYVAQLLDSVPKIIATSAPFTIAPPASNTHTLTITIGGLAAAGTGVEFSASGIDCTSSTNTGISCGYVLNTGTDVVLTGAYPKTTKTIDWVGPCVSQTDDTCSFKMDADKNITVNFDPLANNTNIPPEPNNTNIPPGSGGSVGRIVNPLSNINTLNEFIKKVLEGVLKIGIPIIALMIIYTGFLFVKAQGKPEELKTAKDAFIYTLVGAAILLGAWALAQLISETILSL